MKIPFLTWGARRPGASSAVPELKALSQMFGACANAYANDDGRVVSLDHGCGAHSEVRLSKKQQSQPPAPPVLDTINPDDLEPF